MPNLRLKKTLMEVVENQLRDNDPPCTRETLERLKEKGYTQTEAKEMIASVVISDLYYIMKENKNFDEQKYAKELRKLVKNCDDRTLPEEDLEGTDLVETDLEVTDCWYEISALIYVGYDALKEMNYPEMTYQWLSAWEKVKEIVKNAYKKPSLVEVDEATDFAYELHNWLQDMEMELGNAKENEKRITFCREVLDLFDWEEDSPDNYMAAIGEALQDLGRVKESNEWFEDWLKKEPGNPSCINAYFWCLIERNEIDRAKGLLEETITPDTECSMDNEILFYRAADLYQVTGDKEKAELYKKKAEDFRKKFLEDPLMYRNGNDDYDFTPVQQTVRKEKKIYPNDPCPCGSGKKYKKCCGR